MFTSGFLKDIAHAVPDRFPTCEMPRVLRWLCYCPSQHRLFEFMETYDKTETDSLDLAEFMKVIADYRWSNIRMARAAFCEEKHASEPGATKQRALTNPRVSSAWKRRHVSEICDLLHMVGHLVSEEDCEPLLADAHTDRMNTIDWREFLRLEAFHRDFLKEIFKANLGFNLKETAELRKEFEDNLKSSKKALLYNGLRKIVQKRHPEMLVDNQLRRLVEESDLNKNGMIEFNEFLWIMRRIRDKSDISIMNSAYHMREQLGCSKEEVRSIREIFHSADTDISGFIDFSELQELFSGFVSMCAEAKQELAAYVTKVKGTAALYTCCTTNKDQDTLDFWEFLKVFTEIQANNWRNIDGVARGLTGRSDSHAQAHKRDKPRNRRSLM
jgi:Ca2+-binding EF-hand superfamily protein